MIAKAGHGEQLSRRGEIVIAALLSEGSIPEAAQRANVSERAVRNWLARPDFQRRYRAARAQVLQSAIATLHAGATKAVSTLIRNLDSGRPAVEVTAARVILENCQTFLEIENLAERLDAIEGVLQERQIGGFAR